MINGNGPEIYTDPQTGMTYMVDPVTGNRIYRAMSVNQVAFNSDPQTAEARLTGGVGGVGTQGPNPDTGNLPCERYNYHIGTPQVVKTNSPLKGGSSLTRQDLSTSFTSPNFYPDHRNLVSKGTECILVAPVYRCCWVRSTIDGTLRPTGNTVQVGWATLGRGISLLSYEDCEVNGVKGKKPVIIQYIPEIDLAFGIGQTYQGGPGTPALSGTPVSFRLSDNPRERSLNESYPVWGNCDGEYGVNSYAEWFSQNKYESFGIRDLSSYKINGKYNLINSSGGSVGSDERGFIIEGDCTVGGDCIIPKTPPPPGPPPSVECDSTTIVTPKTATEWLTYAREHSRNSFGFSSMPGFIGAILTDSKGNKSQISIIKGEERQVGLLNDGALVDLESYGSPCRLGQVARFQSVSYTTYPEFTFCQLSNGSTRLVFTGRIIEDRTNPIFDGPIVDKPLVTSQFNPLCCDRLKEAYLSNDEETLNFLSSNGVTVQRIQNTKKYELLDSCSCEEVEIVDMGCFFNNQYTNSTILKADIKNLRTHTGVRRQVVDERCKSDGPDVHHPFDRKRDIILNRTKSSTKGLFDGDDNMECYFTSSTKPTSSNAYYYEVTDCETCGKIPYFAVSYGHISGSGSVFISNVLSSTSSYLPTATDSIYSQYQLMCLEPTRTDEGISLPRFSFVSESVSVTSEDIYVINFNRNGIKDRLDPGNFQINLAQLNGNSYSNSTYTGSNVQIGSTKVMHFIDDSDDFSEIDSCDGDPLDSYNIVSGTLDDGKYQAASINTYGKVYPNLGVVILHPSRLNQSLTFNTVTGSNIAGNNAFKLFTSISGAAAPYSTRTDSYYMTARNVKYKTTSHYFVRAYAAYSNYSNNPTFVSGSKNEIFDKCFIRDPETYITSVGLYNSSYELMAIAKLSKPIKKTFDTDLLIKIRLNW